jgi:hypothetical protein
MLSSPLFATFDKITTTDSLQRRWHVTCVSRVHLSHVPRPAYKSISSRLLDEAPNSLFFYPDGEKWLSRAPGSSFSPEFGLSSIRRAHVIPGPRGALGESGGNKSAGNVEESSRAPGGPDLSARKASRCPHRIVFRAL